ncbi:MAG: ATP-binding protein [Chloroflexi bacterium]|nr:ATP-binding protein [Chloroflexota bacterium]
MAGTDGAVCICPQRAAERYAARVSGPLRDRIDLWVTMPRVAPAILVSGAEPEPSSAVAVRIEAARRSQRARSSALNGRLSGHSLRTACRLDRKAEERAIALAELDGLSARGTERLLRVARSIADLAGDEVVETRALEEAARFRPPMRPAEARAAG